MPHNRKKARKAANDSPGDRDNGQDQEQQSQVAETLPDDAVPQRKDDDTCSENPEAVEEDVCPGTSCGNDADAEDEIECLRRERDEARDKMLRVLAELENYRNRANRERNEALKYASIDLIRDLLPVWDNITRTLEAAEKTPNLEALVDGVRMIDQQFLSVLKQHHCDRIDALGQPFDPNYHASVARMPSEEYAPDTVMYETQPGFVLYDRIVRPTQVVLAGS